MAESALVFATAIDLAARIKRQEVSSVELLQLYWDRIDQYNSEINAIVWQMRDQALVLAQRADDQVKRGHTTLGPLHGVPMTVKESYDVVDSPTTWGIPMLKQNFPERDALAIKRLKDAGAIIFGKTNVPFALADFQSYNDIYGCTNNPWDLTRSPGGSSGGTAASLAMGFTGLDAGSDIGGSIRNPAHFCGVFGHKPTWNLIPPRGHSPPGILASADLSVVGPLARSAHDLKLALEVMMGPDEIQSRGLQVKLPHLRKEVQDLKVAVWEDDGVAPVDVKVVQKVRNVANTIESLGAHVDWEARPDVEVDELLRTYQCLLNATLHCRIPIQEYREIVDALADTDEFDDSPETKVQFSPIARYRDWVQFNEARTKVRWAWHEFFTRYDVLLAPIMATSAYPHDHGPLGERTITVNGEPQPYFKQLFWAGLAINAYLPSTVLPTGLCEVDELPIGVQLIGPEYGDMTTIEVAHILEQEGYRFTPPPAYC